MPKYYVQSGSMLRMVQADNARCAALWAIHCHLERSVPVEQLDWTGNAAVEHAGMDAALASLDDQVAVSQRGFGRHDDGRWSTAGLMTEWHQLIVALTRLQRQLDQPSPKVPIH